MRRIEHGYWYARSADLMQTAASSRLLVWMRVPGDTIFSLGALSIAWFVLRLWVAPKRAIEYYRRAASRPKRERPERCYRRRTPPVASPHMIEFYLQIKWVHVAAVLSSGGLFALRGIAMLAGARWYMAAPLRYLSYTIDTGAAHRRDDAGDDAPPVSVRARRG